jgi:hypothetical protein
LNHQGSFTGFVILFAKAQINRQNVYGHRHHSCGLKPAAINVQPLQGGYASIDMHTLPKNAFMFQRKSCGKNAALGILSGIG